MVNSTNNPISVTCAGHRLELALLGHASERTSDIQYGSGDILEEMQFALRQIDFVVPSVS